MGSADIPVGESAVWRIRLNHSPERVARLARKSGFKLRTPSSKMKNRIVKSLI